MLRASGGAIAALLAVSGCERADHDRSAATVTDTSARDQTATLDLTTRLRTALEQMLRGPSGQPEADDAPSWFSAETADALRSVTVDSTGHATVDFHDLRPLIPNASSSAGGVSLLNELNTTVFRFAGIRSVEYRMEGSCDLFWEWLQYGCRTVTRESAEARR